MLAINAGRICTDMMLVALSGAAILRVTGGKFVKGAGAAAMQLPLWGMMRSSNHSR